MRAVAISQPGEPDVLQLVERELPVPNPGEILIRVAAAGINRPDILQRRGLYPVPPDADPLPGLEVAGHVEALGSGVGDWRVGDRVMALVHGGGYAEYCRVQAAHCLPVPSSLTLVEAAAVPETFFTVWYNVFMRAALRAGETLLVHGGSGGIGSTAIQLAVARGADAIATVSSEAKCRFCETLGARAINSRSGDWSDVVRRLTGDRGIDVVLDMVAGSYVQRNLDLLARDGRYALIAFLDGPRAALDLRRIVTRRLTLAGSMLRAQTHAEKARIAAAVRTNVLPLLENRQVAPIVYQTFSLAEAAAAHRLMESGQHRGKIVLHTDDWPDQQSAPS